MAVPSFQLALLSKFRTSLMGIAAIMIIAVHACDYGVMLPRFLEVLLTYGYLGVDLFLFLSGVGCWYSLSKNPVNCQWYKKRFVRVFVPYIIMQIPFWIYHIIVGTFDFKDQLLTFSTIGFWLKHVGAWYVALLVPLYLLTPPLYEYLSRGKKFWRSLFLILILIFFCSWDIDINETNLDSIVHNIQWAFCRVPSFIIGFSLAPLVKQNLKVSVVQIVSVIIGLIGLYFIVHHFIRDDLPLQFCLVLPIVVFLTWMVSIIKRRVKDLYKFISWIGSASLESYLANIYLCGMISDMAKRVPLSADFLLYGRYLEYFIVVVTGLSLAYYIHRLSAAFMSRIY